MKTPPLFDWRTAVVGSTLSSTCRHVALTLSLHMDEQGGSCFPSVETLATETGLSRRAVQANVSKLVASGWLALRRGGGRGRSNRYEATNPDPIDPETAHQIHGMSNAVSETVNEDPERVHLTARKGAPGAPEVFSSSSEVFTDSRGEPAQTVNGHNGNGRAATPRSKAADPPGFADCWKQFPRKLNRKGAAKAYRARLRAGIDHQELLKATKNYAKTMAGKEPQFVMHGSTFFGPDDRWRDYLNGPNPGPAPGAATLPNGGRVSMTAAEREALGIPVGSTP